MPGRFSNEVAFASSHDIEVWLSTGHTDVFFDRSAGLELHLHQLRLVESSKFIPNPFFIHHRWDDFTIESLG